jgi:uncharacterized membrane protein YdbT with pleckstrin-like domain
MYIMNWATTIYAAILFFVLTPGVLLRLPPSGSKLVVAGVHAVVFALVYHFTHKMVWKASFGMLGHEGFKAKEGMNEEKKAVHGK